MPSNNVSELAEPYPLREERRPAALTGWLVRPGSEQAFDFLIDNLSYGGCRLQCAARLARGDEVQLTVLKRGAIHATVRWHNGEGIGLAFSTAAPKKAEKPRRIERLPLRAELVVRQAGSRARTCEVSDLSRHGCCLTFEDLPHKSEWIWVALPGLSPVEARVRWVDGRRAGVEFVQPIHDAVFDLLLIRWGFST